MKPLTVRVDPALCAGTGFCESIAPELFRVEGETAVYIGPVDDSVLESVREALDLCPQGAISCSHE